MKFHRFATLILANAVAAGAAFSPSFSTATSRTVSRSFMGRAVLPGSSINNHHSYRRSVIPRGGGSRSNTGLSMIFERLFGGGGAVGAGIVYDNLDHPGPELGNAAKNNKVLSVSERDPNLQLATFAGGCFWGLELAYQRIPGVVYTAAGYCQGKEIEPNYNQVCAGMTGHTEAVIVYYDPKETTYEKLLDVFFDRVNPTTVNGQGNDFGKQYRTGVYPHTPEQMEIARKRFESEQTKYKKPIATELKDATPFWPAEKYHQQYLEKGGRFGQPQNAEKGATETIRCYG